MEAYIASKMSMFDFQTKEQKAVVNLDHPIVKTLHEKIHSQIYPFSKTFIPEIDGCFIEDNHLVVRYQGKEESILPLNEIRLQGNHNYENSLAAVMVCVLAGVSFEGIRTALRTFSGLAGRQEELGDIDGVFYINDTTATSPDGLLAALDRFGPNGKIILIAGGASKNLSFDTVAEAVSRLCKFVVLLDGEGSVAFEKSLNSQLPITWAKSMQEAVQLARAQAQKGDIILLSPATASFGLFKNEYDRGQQFVEEVNRWRKK